MGGTSSRHSGNLEENMKKCVPQKSNDSIPVNQLRKVKYNYPSFNCDNASKVQETGFLCADNNYLFQEYDNKIVNYFHQLDECLAENKFSVFMKYYNELITILENHYTVDQTGVIRLKNDIAKIIDYTSDKLGQINNLMKKTTTNEIRIINSSVIKINEILETKLEDYKNSEYIFDDINNDIELNKLKLFSSDEEPNILSDIFFDRVINFYALIYILDNNQKIEKTLNEYREPNLEEITRHNLKVIGGNSTYRYYHTNDLVNYNMYNNQNKVSLVMNNSEDNDDKRPTNTIKRLLGINEETNPTFNIQNTVDSLEVINNFIYYFRNSGPILFEKSNVNKLKPVLDNYINKIKYISEKTYSTWNNLNRNPINYDIRNFKALAKLLFDSNYDKSLIFKNTLKLNRAIDDNFDNLSVETSNKLRDVKIQYIKLNNIAEDLLQLREFNQKYKFKCQQFGNKFHMTLAYNKSDYENYLLNPNNDFQSNPSIYDNDIGPLCIKSKNSEECFDYETMSRCNNDLLLNNEGINTDTGSSFTKQALDEDNIALLSTANGQITYKMEGILFNKNSKLNNTNFSNTNQININDLDSKPEIRDRLTTTTTVPTTTQFINKDIDTQPPVVTRQNDPNVPEDVIPDGVYYLSIVDNTVKNYLTLFQNTENNNFFLQKTTINNRENSIVTVKNVVINEFSNDPPPKKFITINYTDTNSNTFYLQIDTSNHNDRIVIIEKRDTENYSLTDNNYFLPKILPNSEASIINNNVYSVTLESVLPTNSTFEVGVPGNSCGNINNSNNANLDAIGSDITTNSIIHELLALINGTSGQDSTSRPDQIPLIGCSLENSNVHFEFELKE